MGTYVPGPSVGGKLAERCTLQFLYPNLLFLMGAYVTGASVGGKLAVRCTLQFL